jgi:hypothetical protein
MREIDQSLEPSMQRKAVLVRESLRRNDIERARREASVNEWPGLVELYDRLDKERRELIACVRDRWLGGGDLDALVGRARKLARELRNADRASHA